MLGKSTFEFTCMPPLSFTLALCALLGPMECPECIASLSDTVYLDLADFSFVVLVDLD